MKLKIVKNNKEVTLRYGELESGDVFLKGDYLYVKTNIPARSMGLRSGTLVDFLDEHKVYPVDAEVTWRIDC